MKITSPYRCDYCGKDKQEANHWWMRSVTPASFVLVPWNDKIAGDVDGKGEPIYEHICSEQCATKALSKWLGAGR